MCGINFIKSKYKILDFNIINNITRHRGPDNLSYINKNYNNSNYYIGHNRLSIIDVNERSNQPYSLHPDNFLIYNGEIYNVETIKIELLKRKNINWKTSSDTELLYYIMFYEFYDLLDLIDGMFAFIFINSIGDIFSCRDYLGIKPLYYYIADDICAYSSEIKTLKFIIENYGEKLLFEKNDIIDFFQSGSIRGESTGFKNVKQFKRGVLYKNQTPILRIEIKHKKNSLELALKNSMNDQLISDVKSGLLFSGGIDSSLISALLKDKQFTHYIAKSNASEIHNAGISSDYEYANKISKKYNLNSVIINYDANMENIDEILNEVVKGNEELCSDYTFLVSKLICTAAKKNGVKMVLSGMGADELFLGYDRFRLIKYKYIYKLAFILTSPFHNYLKKSNQFSKKYYRLKEFFSSSREIDMYYSLLSNFQIDEISNLVNDVNKDDILKTRPNIYLDQIIDHEIDGFLKHNLLVADKSSMAASVEMRVPFLSNSLYSISMEQRNRNLNFSAGKLTLRNILFKFYDSKYFRRKKAGFNPPMDDLLSKIDWIYFEENFMKSKALNYLNVSFIKKLIDENNTGEKNNTYKIWQIIFFIRWYDEFC